jgi:DNA-binding NtrC family response regulator
MRENGNKVLIIDDSLESMLDCAAALKRKDFRVSTCGQPAGALNAFDAERPDLVLLDVKMPGRSGLDILREIRERDRRVCVIMLSAYGDAETIVRAMKMGADHFVEKGIDAEKLYMTVRDQLERRQMKLELASLRATRDLGTVGVEGIIGRSDAMKALRDKILELAAEDCAVLITGESGVGKDLAAGAIHYESERRARPLIYLFCPGVPKELFESEIFGHERGAYTGAAEPRKGLVEAAGDGTLFLTEIGEIPPPVQAKLLLLIDTKIYMRVGGQGETFRSEARFIAATNVDIPEALDSRRFRQDLYYRLDQASLHIPPLRERPEDIVPLAEHFGRVKARLMGRPQVGLSDRSRRLLLGYDWPGNVREVINVMNRVVMAGTEDVIRQDGLLKGNANTGFDLPSTGSRLKDAVGREVAALESNMIAEALERADGKRTEAAEWLGISYRSLLDKMKQYGLRETG